jgi:hypothetical protein
MGDGGRSLRFATIAAFTAILTACAGRPAAMPPFPNAASYAREAGITDGLGHAIVGFTVDTPARAADAGSVGINATILYSESPTPSSGLAKALQDNGISVIDGSISSELQYWECHRTHTVAPPPGGRNDYCHNDEKPRVDSEGVVVKYVALELERDAQRPYVRGLWVLDDWPYWDYGSARKLLQEIHALARAKVPHDPAICGFAATLARPGRVAWQHGLALNYSNDGCDMVGWYVYTPFGRRKPSNGADLDWSMQSLLRAMGRSLAKEGWTLAHAPLLGIGQAWSGRYGDGYYQPGLSRQQMVDQARGFCAYGASAIAWWAWDDGAYRPRTKTPEDSSVIDDGIGSGIDACRSIWNDAARPTR